MNILAINGKEITARDLAEKVKSSGKQSVLKALVRERIIEQVSAEKNITVSVEELQKAFNSFRESNDLYSVAEAESWLTENAVTLDDIEKEIEYRILASKVREAFSADEVQKYFAENKANMDAAEISILLVKDKDVANELVSQLRDEGSEFALLAQKYSLDGTAKTGGYVGVVQRPLLNPEVAAAVFGSKAGDVLGPFETDQGYTIIKVMNLFPAALNAEKEKEIKGLLYEKMLSTGEQAAKVNWLV